MKSSLYFYFAAIVLFLACVSNAFAAVYDVTYVGPTSGDWNNASYWSGGIVPNNTADDTFNVTIPDNVLVNMSSDIVITNLSLLGTGASVFAGNLTIEDNFVGNGGVLYGGSTIHAYGTQSPNTVSPRILLGGQRSSPNPGGPSINYSGTAIFDATTYRMDKSFAFSFTFSGTTEILKARNDGSLLDLSKVKDFNGAVSGSNYPNNGAYYFDILAMNGGVIDLSGVETLKGAADNDWLRFQALNYGVIKLDSLKTVTGRTCFDIQVAGFALPSLTIADTTMINLATNASMTATNLKRFTNGWITLADNASLDLSGLETVTNSAVELTSDPLVNLASHLTLPTTLNDVSYSTFKVAGKSQLSLPGVTTYRMDKSFAFSFTFSGTTEILKAKNDGSLLDLSKVKDFNGAVSGSNYPNNGGYYFDVIAMDHGVIDLSGVETLKGAVDNDWLRFQVMTGGVINLDSLKTITGRTCFDIQVAGFSLPSLISADTTMISLSKNASMTATNLKRFTNGWITLAANESLDLSGLETLTNSVINLADNALLDLSGLETLTNSAIELTSDPLVNQAAHLILQTTLNDVSYSTFKVTGKSQLSLPGVTTYRMDKYLGGSGTILLQSNGVGALLDMSKVREFNGAAWAVNDPWNGAFYFDVIAADRGVIDLSGVETLKGAADNDWLRFQVMTGGAINLDSLKTVTGRTCFDIQVAGFSLPSLANADTTIIKLATNASMTATNLKRFTNGWITLADNASLDLSGLETLTNSAIELTSDPLVNLASHLTLPTTLNDVSYSTFKVAGKSQLILPNVTTYRMDKYLGGSGATLLQSNGAEALLDMSKVREFNGAAWAVNDPWNGAFYFDVIATDRGVIDLSGVETLKGAVDNDWLRFQASKNAFINLSRLQNMANRVNFSLDTGGKILLGNLSLSDSVTVSIADSNSSLSLVGNLTIKNTGTLSLPGGAIITIGGSLFNEMTDESKFSTSTGIVQFNGSIRQRFEIAGVDSGAVDPGNSGNFAIGQLIVGQTGKATLVDLLDTFNNGNRGSTGKESLYLSGLTSTPDADGLKLNDGSTLVIHDYSVFVKQSGGWLSLQSLFSGSQKIVPYGNGYISKSLTAIPGRWNADTNGKWTNDANWVMQLPNSAGSIAWFSDAITAPRTVTVDSPVIVGSLYFDSINAYTITGTKPVNMQTADGASEIRVENTNGDAAHVVDVRLNLFNDLAITNDSSKKLTISGFISNPNNYAITKDGEGTVDISSSLITQGDITVNQGLLALDGEASVVKSISGEGDLVVGLSSTNANLTAGSISVNSVSVVGNSTLIAGSILADTLAIGSIASSNSSVAIQSVPEPSTLALLAAGAMGVALFSRKKRRG